MDDITAKKPMCPADPALSPSCTGASRKRLLERVVWWTGHILSLLLLATLASLIYGQAGGGAHGLSLRHSYITEYAFVAPHWPWIVVSIFLFAVLLVTLAVGFILRMEQNIGATLGCALLAASAMAMFFVAYTPMRRVASPAVQTHVWWVPQWWVASHTSGTAYEDGMADAYSDVHYRAIRLVLINGLSGLMLLAGGLLARGHWRGFAWFTIVSAISMAVLFVLGDQSKQWHGLWQRLGFALMYVWLWAARLRLTEKAR